MQRIAKRLAKSENYIHELLLLMAMPAKIRKMVTEGKVSAQLAIRDFKAEGKGSAARLEAGIEKAAAKGKTKADVEKMFGQVHEMVMTGNVQGDVGKLAVFAGVHKYPARVKCAILSWHALMGALKGEARPVSTENEQAD